VKTAIYPGSFNPWHDGHDDILNKALKVFEHVVIAQMTNPGKKEAHTNIPKELIYPKYGKSVSVFGYHGLLVDCVKQFNAVAVVRGLRNAQDFEFEKIQQYWNEDLGLLVPEVYFIADRNAVHLSSTAIRQLEMFKK
jgi:pantetheine-phosphate adenylyltransferase